MAYHESYLKLIKSSWGIVIGYKGEIISTDKENPDPDFEQLCDSVFLKLRLTLNHVYVEQIKILIENGIRWIAVVLPVNSNLYITVTEIDFNMCNFQIEGFFFGVANWLCNYFNIEMPQFSYFYDRKLNSYFFYFDEDDNDQSFNLLYPEVEG